MKKRTTRNCSGAKKNTGKNAELTDFLPGVTMKINYKCILLTGEKL